MLFFWCIVFFFFFFFVIFFLLFFFFFQAEDGIRDGRVTGVQTCALPICKDLGYGLGEVFRGEPAVVSDDGERIARARFHVLRAALRDPPHVAKGEIVRDDAPPAIRAELDRLSCHFAPRLIVGAPAKSKTSWRDYR